jgi:predicted transcriptional regulator
LVKSSIEFIPLFYIVGHIKQHREAQLSMKYRSRTDIVAQILEASNGGVTKTKIMYKAYLSYAQLREYLSILIQNGLIEYHEKKQEYKTTAKGLQFLKAYHEIGQIK